MIPLKKTSTNIIVSLTSMAFFAGFVGYTNHYDLSKNIPTVNSAPTAISSQEVQPILPKAESVAAKVQVPLASAKAAVSTSPVTVSPPTPQAQVAAQPAPPLSSPPAPIVVAKADTTQAPAPSKTKTTKTRAS